MILQFNELATDLARIRRFLQGVESNRLTTDQRRFTYIACVSALYATFENFTERSAFRFSQMLFTGSKNCNQQQVEDLKRRYVRNASMLLNQTLGSGRYSEVTEADVARSLMSCLDDREEFEPLLELVAFHGSNLRWEALADLLRWAVPDLHGKVRNSDALENWMRQTSDVTDTTLLSVLANELDDLVERRNEVSHRAIPDEILAADRLVAKVNFIEALALGLLASLAGTLMQTSVENGKSPYIGRPTEYYKQKRVVVIPSLHRALAKGDIVLAPARKSVRWGRVLELQVNDKQVDQAEAGAEVGILLDFICRKGVDLHLWSEPSHELAIVPDGLFGSYGPLDSEGNKVETV